jgi:putative transposase
MATGARAKDVRNFYGYSLGVSLRNYGVLFHGGNQMGNHHHLDVTDVRAERVNFKISLHGHLARGFNALRGRFDDFWAGGGSCDTCQPTDEESLEDLAYTDANPVTAGLVKWGHQWPGFTTYGWRFGETRTFKRPDWYRDPDNPDNPPEITITRVRPDIFPELSDDELFEKLMKRIREIELQAHAEMRNKGRRFKGLRKLGREQWNRAPTTWEDRFTVEPKVVASSRWRVLAQLQRNRTWEREYAEARARHRRHEDSLYPYGTYWMRVHACVRVAQAPP